MAALLRLPAQQEHNVAINAPVFADHVPCVPPPQHSRGVSHEQMFTPPPHPPTPPSPLMRFFFNMLRGRRRVLAQFYGVFTLFPQLHLHQETGRFLPLISPGFAGAVLGQRDESSGALAVHHSVGRVRFMQVC